MLMDKGLSTNEVENFLSVAGDHTDIVKLGWATSFVTPNLAEKLKIYREAGIPVYFGGTLFEAFIIRGQFDDYRRVLEKYDMAYAEVSDGSITIDHDAKRSEENTSELQSLMRISYAVFCLKKKQHKSKPNASY